MVTIEASNIYFRGGLVLLEQILQYCNDNNISTKVYIGYKEVYDYIENKKYTNCTLLFTSGFQTLLRYFKKRSNVLFFCNLPPFVRNNKSVLYAHNILFFQSPKPEKGSSVIFNIKKFLYFYWIKLFAKNVDVVACQTEAVKKSLEENMGIDAELYPFFKEDVLLDRDKIYDFCYVSSGAIHKNNERLLEAIDNLSSKYLFRVCMTIQETNQTKEVIDKIEEINRKHSRKVIYNKGLVPSEVVAEIYSSSNALIFPSLAETIGLPLIEALQYGLKVISSDLPFTHQVVENPIVFNPESVEDIMSVMENQLNGKYDSIIQSVKLPNRLPELIERVVR